MVEIYFATNRNRLPNENGEARFGQLAGPGAQGIAFGRATVENVALDDPGSGVITSCEVMNLGGIGPELSQSMLADGRDLCVFVHGAANTFVDSIQRAAFNGNWLNALPGSNLAVLVFSWPARHYDLWNVLGDLENYRQDQAQARASAPHFIEFLKSLYSLRPALGARRLTLMAHSMGNYALAFGVESWFATPSHSGPLFDSVILAAADEQSTSFGLSAGARLSDLWELAPVITIYSSREDVLILTSHIVNHDWRLGFDGPPNRPDTAFFPREHYVFVDCTGIEDYTNPLVDSPDRSHQYYRQSETVRRDIGRVLRGQEAPAGARSYDARRNVFTLPIVVA
jgi:esterase/lipase superfamily enzyme